MLLKISKPGLFLGGAMAASLAGSTVYAQTASQGQAAGATNNTASSPQRLSEVIVTAQRRSENVQSIPISVNALTAEQLEAKGATTSEDLTAIAPALVFNPGLGGGQVTIRGIGGTNSGSDPGNAVYIDGVYQYSPQANLFYFNAVDRIEVLKGPQGTLFGRNAAGGLIQVITRDPSTARPSGEMTVGYASYNTASGNLYLNAPLTDNIAANVAAFGFDQQDGWGRNLATGNEIYKGYAWGVRAKVKWTAPDGKTDATLAGYYNKDKPVGYGPGTLPPGQTNIAGMPSVGIYNANSNLDSYRTDRQYTVSATLHHDFGFARLTSITAYDSVHAPALADAAATPFPLLNIKFNEDFHTLSQEFHLQSEQGSRLQWILGLLYLHDSNPGKFVFSFFPPITPGPAEAITTNEITTKSYAAFGQATYALTDDTKVTMGLRYTNDRSELVAPGDPTHRTNVKRPTWRFALDHEFTPDVLGYVSYSRGFKSGVFNNTTPAHPSADPEILDAYEAGIKTETFDHRLRVNAAVFYYDFKKVQVLLFTPGGSAYIDNVGDAKAGGLDLDAAAEPIPGLTLTAGLSLIPTKFTSGTGPCFTPAAAGTTEFDCPLEGKRLPFAPRFTGSLGANYKIPAAVGDFVLSGNYSHNSGYFSDAGNFAPARTPAFDTINLSVDWTSTSGHLNASVWGKNLLNQHVVGGYNVGAGVGSIAVGYPLAPVTVGGTIGVKF